MKVYAQSYGTLEIMAESWPEKIWLAEWLSFWNEKQQKALEDHVEIEIEGTTVFEIGTKEIPPRTATYSIKEFVDNDKPPVDQISLNSFGY